jgi:ABC-2 type transport system permease protein
MSHLGMKAHYESINKGVIDTRDLIYFVSKMTLFLALATYRVRKLVTKS